MSRLFPLSIALLLPLVTAGAAWAGHGHCRSGCAPATCAPATCAPTYVEKTVCVPTWVMETRTVDVIECTTEQRQKTCTVYRQVPETKTIETQCTVMVPETRTKTCNYTVCTPVWRDVEKQYTVMVPHKETRQGTRKVCKMEQVTETRTVCKDQGHWEEQVVEVPCSCTKYRSCRARRGCCSARRCGSDCGSDCGSACGGNTGCGGSSCSNTVTCTKKVWVPNIVQEEVEVTCSKPVLVEEPYEYCVTVCKPETRTCTVKVCEYVKEERTREVQYTVCVPQQRTVTRQVCVVKCIPEERVVTYTVQVPHRVQKQVQVRVCKMVPKTVQVPCCPPRQRCCARPAKTCCAPAANCGC